MMLLLQVETRNRRDDVNKGSENDRAKRKRVTSEGGLEDDCKRVTIVGIDRVDREE